MDSDQGCEDALASRLVNPVVSLILNSRKEYPMSAKTIYHQEIVRKLIETKAVDFAAAGKVVAELGPTLALAEEPWEDFCGTMRNFIRLYRIGSGGLPVEDLRQLGAAGAELKG